MKRPDLPVKLDDLPMFATDQQIAEAIVGKDKAEKWMREKLPALAKMPGFPAIDEFFGGRPVAHVARYFENWLGKGSTVAPPGREDRSGWKTDRSKRQA